MMEVLYGFLILVPVALVLEYANIGGHAAFFIVSGLAMIRLAAVLGKATEEAAIYTGPRIGALLNATLGNAAEFISTIVALCKGVVNVVKASIAGSILRNIQVVLGFSFLPSGLRHGCLYAILAIAFWYVP